MRGTAVAAVAALVLAGCVAAPPPVRTAPALAAAPVPVEPSEPPATMQWLYGSGEAGAVSLQTYHAFRDFVLFKARERVRNRLIRSTYEPNPTGVILAEGSTLSQPRFVPCLDKPPAVVLDVDETVLLNLGLEYAVARGIAPERELLARWHETENAEAAPVPGAVAALQAIRRAGVKVIYNTNRDAKNARFAAAALERHGLGPAVHGDTLFLRGDPPGDRGKDGRRTLIANRYCVLAMVGDQLGDFSELFNARGLGVQERRRAATSQPFAQLWGAGWFMIPNPVYGPGLEGRIDEVFPAGTRWSTAGGN